MIITKGIKYHSHYFKIDRKQTQITDLKISDQAFVQKSG